MKKLKLAEFKRKIFSKFTLLRKNTNYKKGYLNVDLKKQDRTYFQENKREKKSFKNFFRFTVRNKIMQIIFICLFLIFFGFLINFFFFSENFQIKYVEIKGISNLSYDFFNEQVSNLKGKNVFLVRSSGLIRDFQNNSAYIYDVDVEKELPNKIIITISERNPFVLWTNFSGLYLVDDQGIILEKIREYEEFSITQEQLDILKGYQDLNDLEKNVEIEESEEGEVKIELSEEEKQTIIEQNKLEVISRVEVFFSDSLEVLDEKYKKFRLIYHYVFADYDILDHIDKDIYNSSYLILKKPFPSIDVEKYIWESDYKFVLFLAQDKKIIFSSKRDVTLQLESLEVLIESLNKKGEHFKYIDLRSDVIVYEIE